MTARRKDLLVKAVPRVLNLAVVALDPECEPGDRVVAGGILGVLALVGTAAFVWSRLRRTTKVLHAVEDGVEALDAGAKAAVKHAATQAGVEPDLNASLAKRGMSKGP